MRSNSLSFFPRFSCLWLLIIASDIVNGTFITKSPEDTSLSVVTRGHNEQLWSLKGAPRRYKMIFMLDEWLLVIVTVSPFHVRVLGFHRIPLRTHPTSVNSRRVTIRDEVHGQNGIGEERWSGNRHRSQAKRPCVRAGSLSLL
ncbi:uncharacterized protein EDB91DRAFT_1172515 [Suillus paluster]|uniref:uncharacterized protein n=1 Tax=Suillus paluster TaxID=48578 RepID=UPI001B8760C6|nr:uncharacterized protein EDB91DRAFT_1172515 [Suillus paluster]KAG1723530.1 hypothetical protein EDB91DRAFT_1172515 [Suillus paluster]